jgi:hypothetical protein
MPKKIGLFFLLFACSSASGSGLPLGELGDRLEYTGFEVVWEAPTNRIPHALAVYRALTTTFPPSVVSNLMALGSFTLKDKVGALGPPPFNDPRALCFYIPAKSRSLGIYPSGFIDYRDNLSVGYGPGQNAPSEEDAFRSGTNYLRTLGLNLSGFVTDSDDTLPRARYSASQGWVMTNGVSVNIIPSSSISFTRQMDGVEFLGNGWFDGCFIEFGHDGQLYRLRVLWRNLKCEKSYPTLTPEAMMQRLRDGKCVWNPYGLAEPAWIKKIIITKATPYYYGKDPTETQNYVYPFADLTTTLEMVRTNIIRFTEHPKPNTVIVHSNILSMSLIRTNITMRVCCPIIDDNGSLEPSMRK